MVDFATILKTAIGNAGADQPETRAGVYQRARDAIARFVANGAPEAEGYTALLEAAIAETESSYNVTMDGPIRTLVSDAVENDTCQLEPDLSLETSAEPLSAGNYDATRVSDALAEGTADNADPQTSKPQWTPEQVNFLPVDFGLAPPDPITQSLSYKLDWSTSCQCSICHKWALCIDPAHCWNRD